MTRAPDNTPLPRLQVPAGEARERIRNRLERGELLRSAPITSNDDLRHQTAAFRKWHRFNRELLLRLFDNDQLAEEYDPSMVAWRRAEDREPTFDELVTELRRDISRNLLALDSILERLDLFPEPDDHGHRLAPLPAGQHSRRIFVVHGHDEATKHAVARFLEKLELHPVILHEQANQGRTLIEKFEAYASVDLAVVLLTADDHGSSLQQPTRLVPRARQNVILELGYLMGRLGRKKVCALYMPGVELPSDYSGIVYIELDSRQGWRIQLAAELKAAGLPIDLNRAL